MEGSKQRTLEELQIVREAAKILGCSVEDLIDTAQRLQSNSPEDVPDRNRAIQTPSSQDAVLLTSEEEDVSNAEDFSVIEEHSENFSGSLLTGDQSYSISRGSHRTSQASSDWQILSMNSQDALEIDPNTSSSNQGGQHTEPRATVLDLNGSAFAQPVDNGQIGVDFTVDPTSADMAALSSLIAPPVFDSMFDPSYFLMDFDALPLMMPSCVATDNEPGWDYVDSHPLLDFSAAAGSAPFASTVPDSECHNSSLVIDSDLVIMHEHSQPILSTQEITLLNQTLNQRRSSALGSSRNGATNPTSIKRIKKTPFKDPKMKQETGLTRKYNACLRCRSLRNRCVLDPDNLSGPCISCRSASFTMARLPCLRYKITDSTLFRTRVGPYTFYVKHPMVGPKYGDFHLSRTWIGHDDGIRVMEITQDRGPVARIKVREFLPPVEPDALDLRGNPIYFTPWAIADLEETVREADRFAEESIETSIYSLLDDADYLTWRVFIMAQRLSVFPAPNKLLRDVLKLWTVCRFIEGNWRCCGNDNLNSADLKHKLRGEGWISPPPYLDYQWASITMHRILGPLRRSVLNSLQSTVLAKRSQNWFVIFLTVYILLHNYELSLDFQFKFWKKRKAPLRYMDMELIRATHSGAKVILAHFHYCCKGQKPFQPDFDWDSPQIQTMAQLDKEEVQFMREYSARVQAAGDKFRDLKESNDFHQPYWYTSQLFDPDWKPMDTDEHSPPAD